jgi:polyphosphate glucokinase
MKKSSAKKAAKSIAKNVGTPPRTFVIDIGGTGIKALTLDAAGKPTHQRTRVATPKRATPKDIVEIARKLAKDQPAFERVSVGFPGVVKDGVIYTATNLGNGWHGFDLGHTLERKLKKPARIHLELAHHPFHKGKTYEEELGNRALHKKGRKKWNKLLREAIEELQNTFNYDRLYIGGGNSRLMNFKLPANVKLISNEDGLLGGIALWREAKPSIPSRTPAKAKAASAPAPAKARVKAVEKSQPQSIPKTVAKPARPVVAQPSTVARTATSGGAPTTPPTSARDVSRPSDAPPARSAGMPSSTT